MLLNMLIYTLFLGKELLRKYPIGYAYLLCNPVGPSVLPKLIVSLYFREYNLYLFS